MANIREEYMQVPPITRVYTTACVVTTLAVVSLVPYMSCLLIP